MGLSPGAQRRPAGRASPPAESAPGLGARKTAAALLRNVIERRTPLDSLLDDEHGNPHVRALEPRDRGLVRAILGVALRRRGEIEVALQRVLDRPLPEDSGALAAILHIGAAQILFLDVPDHAAVDLAVAHAGSDRRTGRARGLVNAVLRRIAAERESIVKSPDAGRRNTPTWLFERWEHAYGSAAAEKIAEAHLHSPGLDLSPQRDGEAWAEKLGGTLLPIGTIRLAETHRVPELPGYDEGAWWVQDAAAALPARFLGDVAGKRVADLCAAPGGKTAQLAAAGADVTAVDISATRLKRVAKNLERLRLSAKLVAADLLDWSPGEKFDAVLLDAPCTATGTIRLHPDISWLKQPEDVAHLASLQRRMLERAAEFVRPGGTLVFCTCSLEPEESEQHVTPFLTQQPDFALMPIGPHEIFGLSDLVTPDGFLRTLPSQSFGAEEIMHGMDGFFAARFRRA